jgi:DNA-binding NarL/FixJ family response regulator
VAEVLILSADLMFGSRLLASLKAAGHEVDLVGDEDRLRSRLSDARAGDPKVLIADLTDDRLDGASTLESLRGENLTGSLRTLAFFSHVEADVRERAQQAGFDLVVARSRIARDAATLVTGLTTR